MPIELVIRAINNLDLKQLSLENVEILQKMTPTEQEIKNYREYVAEKKDVNMLTDEDKFMMHLTRVERIASKLAIMNYMGNFFDSLHLINPVRFSKKLTCLSHFSSKILIPANQCRTKCIQVGQTIEKIPFSLGNCVGLWKLFE